MVTLLARQSVIIKCNMQRGYLLGNYEFYYAAGLAGKLYGFEIEENIRPQELSDKVKEGISSAASNEKQEEYLISILKDYVPLEEYDEQMKELLLWGKTEKFLWQVNT